MTWRERAACLNRPDLDATWVGEDHDPAAVHEAKRVCWSCPSIDECKAELLAPYHPRDVAGVVAGTCDEDRRARCDRRPRPGCGTNRGYDRHRYVGESACDACREAHRKHNRRYQRAVAS